MKRCLDIGSGPYPYNGEDGEHWEHLDGVGGPDVDYLALAYPLPMFSDCTFDKVRASHILEHFHWSETVQVLREWVRILKPGGTLTIDVPNMEEFAKKILHGGMNDGIASQIYARATCFWDVHRAGFDAGHLERKLIEAGMNSVMVRGAGDGIHSTSTKVHHMTDDIIKGKNPDSIVSNSPVEILRNDVGRVDRVRGKSFCIINNRGWGDLLASLSLATKLKENGAAWVAFGSSTISGDDSLVRANESCDYIFRTGINHMINQAGAWCYQNADYIIDQREYRDTNGFTFYTLRISDAFGTREFEDVRPSLELAGHVDDAIEGLCKEWRVDRGNYYVLHPQSAWPDRTMNKESIGKLIELLDKPCVVIGYDVDFDDRWNAINFGKRNGMDIVAGVIKHSKAFIGVDSVWSHVAFAYDKPSFVFYGPAPAEIRLAPHHSKLAFQSYEPKEGNFSIQDFTPLVSWINSNHDSLK